MDRKCMFSTGFWEDKWIADLDPTEKFFYIYLFTNPNSNMLGYFSLPIRRICYDTGLKPEIVQNILDKFENTHQKIIYDNEWVFVKNVIKHQTLNNIKVKKGIVRMISEIQNTTFKMKIINTFKDMQLIDFVNYICNETGIELSDIDKTCIGHTSDIDKTCIGHEQNGYILNTLPNLIKKQQQVVVKNDVSSGDDPSDVVVVVDECVCDEKNEENTESGSTDKSDIVNLSKKQGKNQSKDTKTTQDSSLQESKEFDQKNEEIFPPVPARPRYFEKLHDRFHVVREMKANGISPDHILTLYNQHPVIDLTRWWLWAKVKSKSNIPGFYLTLIAKMADEVPKDVLELIKPVFSEILESERLIEERKRRML